MLLSFGYSFAMSTPFAVHLRRHATRWVALALASVFFVAARQPSLSSAGRHALAARFAFDDLPLVEPPGDLARPARTLAPPLEHIAGWMSGLGAAAALADLDGDGLPNDVCWIEPRLDAVVVEPAPTVELGSGRAPLATPRYPLFDLVADPGRKATAPMGCLPVDLNEDGAQDLVVYYWGRPPVAFLRRPGTGLEAAAFVPVPLAPADEVWNTNAALAADVDGDGHLDLVFGNYFPDGDRLLDPQASGDLHMQASMSRSTNGGRNRLLLWRSATAGAAPGVEFTDASDAFTPDVANAWTLAIAAADLDGDLLPELYFANDFGSDRLLANRSTPGHPAFTVVEGRKGFAVPTSKVLGHDSFKGMGAEFADVDGDGRLDLYVSNIAEPWALLESHFLWRNTGDTAALRAGRAPFVEASEAFGLARSAWCWDARLADFDDDGVPEAMQACGFWRGAVNRWPELHELAMGNDGDMPRAAMWPRLGAADDLSGRDHNPFFVRAADGRYYDVAAEVGLGRTEVSRGLAVGDVDGDGRLDVVVADQWQSSHLLHNRSAGTAVPSFLELDVELPVAGTNGAAVRPAVGAEITVTLPDGSTRFAEIDGGNGHSGKRAPEAHFGLGALPPTGELAVTIRYRAPGGAVREERRLLPPGRHRIVLAPNGHPA